MISDQGIFEILNLSPVIVSDLDRKDSKLVLSQKTLEELSEKLHFKVSSGTVYNLSEKFLLNKSSKDTLANKILEEESLIYKNSVGPDSKNIPILMFGKYEFKKAYEKKPDDITAYKLSLPEDKKEIIKQRESKMKELWKRWKSVDQIQRYLDSIEQNSELER